MLTLGSLCFVSDLFDAVQGGRVTCTPCDLGMAYAYQIVFGWTTWAERLGVGEAFRYAPFATADRIRRLITYWEFA